MLCNSNGRGPPLSHEKRPDVTPGPLPTPGKRAASTKSSTLRIVRSPAQGSLSNTLSLVEHPTHPNVYMLSQNPIHEHYKKRSENEKRVQAAVKPIKHSRSTASLPLDRSAHTPTNALEHACQTDNLPNIVAIGIPQPVADHISDDRNAPCNGKPTPLSCPFPKAAPQPISEAELVHPMSVPFPLEINTMLKTKTHLKNLEQYALAAKDCTLAWHKKLRQSVFDTSMKLISTSRTLRSGLIPATPSNDWRTIHTQTAVKNVESWEILFKGHGKKADVVMGAAELAKFWKVGEYLADRVRESNNQLLKLAGLPVGLDGELVNELVGRIHAREFEKKGFFTRLVDQTLAQWSNMEQAGAAKKIEDKRTIPDLARYPIVATTAPRVPMPPVPSAAYFDQHVDSTLTGLSLELRAATIAFHLICRHHQATGIKLAVPRDGKYLSNAIPLGEANLPTLVRYLTDHFESMNEEHIILMDAFFRFFRYITSPSRLLRLLTKRYHETPSVDCSREEKFRWQVDHVFTKLFIVRMIDRWLECYYIHSRDNVILPKLREFTFEHVAADQDVPGSAAKLISLHLVECHAGRRGVLYAPILERTIVEGQKCIKSYPETPFRKHLPALGRLKADGQFDVASILLFGEEGGPEELARALTRRAAVRFQRSLPSDLIHWRPKHSLPWLDEKYTLSEALARWASCSILHHELIEDRVKAYQVIVEVAWICFQMRNFSSSFAITVALIDKRIVGRLKETLELVATQHHSYLRQLEGFYRSEADRAYHEEMRRIIAPAVPHSVAVGAELKQLRTKTQKSFISSIMKGADEKTPIDLHVLRSLGGIVTELEHCYIPYKVPVLALVSEWLSSQLKPLEDCDDRVTEKGLEEFSRLRKPDTPHQ
ncbi:ras guanine nucleotide exchange factor domain-containing protein [Cytidiella melzeri]|nr:ras guanine nucleotide exchange factor domain-containing protein [Cytidiella melzeri]